MAIALDPDIHPDDIQPIQTNTHAEVDADLIDYDKMDAAVQEELQLDGKRPPIGWRIDRFRHRLVSVPPWSRRPPTCEPEVWTAIGKHVQTKLRDD